ncbi:flagellar hook-basal body complex protein FliE [Actibacterium sp. MT2.3-13A]|uniref:flagellar hook-basal body complex protein FliE n=1 Tax=Actibacterium sp. MT2.3-13A TaxID=2828332 RepID=UPI001BAA5D0B|nr:flagellar hook-basal body complex protein FliE [Actibacterium sp. MT2.3-13A]
MTETTLLSTGAIRGAYRSSQDLRADSAETAGDAAQAGGASFSEMLREASVNALHEARAADAMVQAGLQGEVNTQQVVQAALELESTVKLAVSVRDKFVAAYQEVMRMPI